MAEGGSGVNDKSHTHGRAAGLTRREDAALGSVEPIDVEPKLSRDVYKAELHALQVEFVKLQRHLIACSDRILVQLEGCDSAGEHGSSKRIGAHLSLRDTRVVALGKPSRRDRRAWHFELYVKLLPVAEALVLFARHRYDHTGVERVMDFCTRAQYREFMQSVLRFEQMLVDSGIRLLKCCLDLSMRLSWSQQEAHRAGPQHRLQVDAGLRGDSSIGTVNP